MHYVITGVIILGITILIIRFRSVVLFGFELGCILKQRRCIELTRQMDLLALLKLQRRVKKMEKRLHAFEQRRIAEGYICPTKKQLLIASSWFWTSSDQKRFVELSKSVMELDEQITHLTQPMEQAMDRWMKKK